MTMESGSNTGPILKFWAEFFNRAKWQNRNELWVHSIKTVHIENNAMDQEKVQPVSTFSGLV